MSKLTLERAHEILEINIQRIYHLSDRYEAIHYYLDRSSGTKKTLLSVLNFLKDKKIILEENKYIFFLDYTTFQKKVRRGQKRITLNKYMCLLCAIGFFKKQSSRTIRKLKVNQAIPRSDHAMSFYSYREWTDKELEKMETNARTLRGVKVNLQNISHDYLLNNGLKNMAYIVYPWNRHDTIQKKEKIFYEVMQVLDDIVSVHGYCTREMLYNAAPHSEETVKRIIQIFRGDIQKAYVFKRPSKDEKEKYGLISSKFIYVRGDDPDADTIKNPFF